MFDSYFSSQKSRIKTVAPTFSFSTLLHVCIIVGIIVTPFATIKALPLPSMPVEFFDNSAPPPPPPPPPKPKPEVEETVTEELVEPEEAPEEIPEPKEEPPPPPPPVVEEESVGQEGGVEGGFDSGMPAKLLIKSQRKISGQAPRFPQSARTQGLSATLAARVCITAKGRVKSVRILSGSPIFRPAVKDAVMTWKYEPYYAGSRPIPTCFPAYFNFNLKG